jgi:phage protein D
MPTQYAPEYRLTIDGAPIPPALRGSVVRLSHQDGIVGSDRVELTVADPTQRWLDDPLLQVDNGLTLSLGYAPGPLDLLPVRSSSADATCCVIASSEIGSPATSAAK